MCTKRLTVPLVVFIVIGQCSGISVWQAIKDFKNTIFIPDDVIDMRTNPPWPNCADEGQADNRRMKRDNENSINKSNTTEAVDNTTNDSLESLQDDGNFTTNITDNVSLEDNVNVTAPINMTQFDYETTENVTSLMGNISETNDDNMTIIENDIQMFDNITETIENITNNASTVLLDNNTIIIENETQSTENNTELIKGTNYEAADDLTTDEITTATDEITTATIEITTTTDEMTTVTDEMTTVTDEMTTVTIPQRSKREITEDDKEVGTRNTSETNSNDQSVNTTLNQKTNLTETKTDEKYNSSLPLLENGENSENSTLTVHISADNTDNENRTGTGLIENDQMLNGDNETINIESQENYNITNIYKENNTDIYSTNFTDNNLTIDEDMNGLTSSNESVVSDFEMTSNETNGLNITSSSEVNSSIALSGSETNNELPSNYTILNETELNLTNSEAVYTVNVSKSNVNKEILTQNERGKREITINLTSANAGTANLSLNVTLKAGENLTTNQTFSADNATSFKTEASNGSISVNETAMSSAAKDSKVAATTEKVCFIQGEACTNSTQCCENFECTMFDIIKWSSNCDFKPSDPLMATPLADVRIPKVMVAAQRL